MYYPTQWNFSALMFNRLLGSMGLAALVTFAIFVLMDTLTRNDETPIVDLPEPPVITVAFQHKEKPTPKKEKLQPPKEPKVIPKTLKPVEASPDDQQGLLVDNIDVPKLGPDVGFDELVIADTGARPIVRMQPKYPIDAARNGVEGWVKLIFSIDASGAVKDIEVIDAEPKRIFNKAARKALSKWKYKPQMIAGKPVEQSGLEVVLDFNLDQG